MTKMTRPITRLKPYFSTNRTKKNIPNQKIFWAVRPRTSIDRKGNNRRIRDISALGQSPTFKSGMRQDSPIIFPLREAVDARQHLASKPSPKGFELLRCRLGDSSELFRKTTENTCPGHPSESLRRTSSRNDHAKSPMDEKTTSAGVSGREVSDSQDHVTGGTTKFLGDR